MLLLENLKRKGFGNEKDFSRLILSKSVIAIELIPVEELVVLCWKNLSGLEDLTGLI
jgi:hypothetical protein